MNSFETFLHGIGLSWTISKLIPYILFPLLGLLVWNFFRKRIARRAAGFILLLLLVPGAFIAYFVMHPIYEGDFSNDSTDVTLIPELNSKVKPALVIVSIPDCPHCMDAILRMKEVKEQNPDINIEFRVCTTKKSALQPYKEAIEGVFPVVMAKDPERLANAVAAGSFPTFVLLDKEKSVKWLNDDFGVGALDEVESKFEDKKEKEEKE